MPVPTTLVYLENSQFTLSASTPRLLTRFSIIEGTQASLERLGLDYVDVLFAHRPDPSSQCVVVLVGASTHVA